MTSSPSIEVGDFLPSSVKSLKIGVYAKFDSVHEFKGDENSLVRYLPYHV